MGKNFSPRSSNEFLFELIDVKKRKDGIGGGWRGSDKHENG